MQLILDTRGIIISKRNKCFWIRSKKNERIISPMRISSIAVLKNCIFTTQAIRLAAQHGIPIYFNSETGHCYGRLWGPGFSSLATLRKKQAYFVDSPQATALILHTFRLKAGEQIKNLNYLKRRRSSHQNRILTAIEKIETGLSGLHVFQNTKLPLIADQLRGREGAMAAAYWRAVAAVLPPEAGFSGRNRQPALDPFNCVLNYLYGVLYNLLESAVFAAGLDPYMGILHRDQYKKPVLAYDLIEPFRPWVDKLAIQFFLDKKISAASFMDKGKGIWLSKTGKRTVLPAINELLNSRRMWQGKITTHHNHVYRFLREIANQIKQR